MILSNALAYRTRPLYTINNYKIQHLELNIFTHPNNGLVNISSISKLPKETRFIQHDSIVYYDSNTEAILVKSKQEVDKHQINREVKPLFYVIKAKESSLYKFYIKSAIGTQRFFANNFNSILLTHISEEQKLVIKKGCVFYMGNVRLKVINIQAIQSFPQQDFELVRKKYEAFTSDKCCGCHNITQQLVRLCSCQLKFHPKCLIQSLKSFKLSKFVKTKATSFNSINQQCACGLTFSNVSQQLLEYIFMSNFNSQNKIIEQGSYKLILQIQKLQGKKSLKDYIFCITNQKEISIGRDVSNDIEIDQLSVSRNHLKLTLNKDCSHLELIDLKSTFGTLMPLSDEKMGIQGKKTLIFGKKIIELTIPPQK